MKFAIEITGPDSWNVATVSVTRIDERCAIHIAWLCSPTDGELEAVCEGVSAYLEEEFGGKATILGTDQMGSLEESQAATRKFFGGGQG